MSRRPKATGPTLFGIVTLATFMLFGPATAGSFEVAPTTVRFPANEGMTEIRLRNHGAERISTQIEAFAWQQPDGADSLVPTDDLVVSPPLATIEPGQEQIIRLAVRRTSSDSERTFRILVSELPKPIAQDRSKIHVLLQLSLPVFTNAARVAAPMVEWTAGTGEQGKLILSARNKGASHVKLASLKVKGPSGRPLNVAPANLAYILPGSERSWSVSGETLAPGTVLELAAYDESRGLTLNANAVVSR